MFVRKTNDSQIYANRPKRYWMPPGGSVTI
jgi:hypothetical protein